MAKRPTPPTADAPPRAPRKAGRPTSAKPPRPRAVKAKPAPDAAPPPPPPQAEAHAAEAFAFPGADQRQMLETLSMNLAKAAMTAQSAIAEAALSQADRPAALSPDPFNVGPAINSVMTSLASRPDKLFAAQADLFNRYMDLWATTTRRAAGDETPAAHDAKLAKDKRFRDPAWTENPAFDVMRQSYLVTADWMNGLVSSVEDVDPLVKRRAEFFTKLLTDAFSPSNFLASNPVALKALAESNGESLVRGMQNFAADMERGAGKLKISQADYGKFVVGENVATAPGQV
ncbi:MAG: class I poly(R)-hydroxyalkanoic acid synthase, partial [Alphaproteobacteria bacterium]|nr:class I poly(R)-hydroxyalkanoic acid synthase [Alphaproteobacteria bacterium]